MNLIIRQENAADYDAVETLTREAFWDIYQPGCDEHLLAHKLRKETAFIPELDFVGELDGRLVGNIMYSKAIITDETGTDYEVITFGPLSVLPLHQRSGIGSALIKHTMKLAEELGYKAVVIYGNPAYYHRFGFANAAKFHISTGDGENFEAFMVKELVAGALHKITGRYQECPAFQIDKAEVAAFDQKFPYKEKHTTQTQFR